MKTHFKCFKALKYLHAFQIYIYKNIRWRKVTGRFRFSRRCRLSIDLGEFFWHFRDIKNIFDFIVFSECLDKKF